MVNATGILVERYEYTPYGRRTIFTHNWLLADMNDDGAVNGGDYAIWADHYGDTDKPESRAYLNGDGEINGGDDTIYGDSYGDSYPSNDALVTYPTLESARGLGGGPLVPLITGICDTGHQGLLFDKEFGLYYNRARYLHPTLGRFCQRDPSGYVDGMSLYQYVRSAPLTFTDPRGYWRLVPRNRDPGRRMYEATKDGDSLEELARKGGGADKDWVCLWRHPGLDAEPVDEDQAAKTWKEKKAPRCAVYSIANLRFHWSRGRELRVTIGRADLADKALLGSSAYFETGRGVIDYIAKQSKQGRSPIKALVIAGHGGAGVFEGKADDGGPLWIVGTTIQANPDLRTWMFNGVPEYKESYERAKQEKGPARCWFARGARLYAISCSSEVFAREMAKNVLRGNASAVGAVGDIYSAWLGMMWFRYPQDPAGRRFGRGESREFLGYGLLNGWAREFRSGP